MNGPAQVLLTHTPALFDAAVQAAVEVLRAGDVVALPTETVYGLAANALDAGAVAKIFVVKRRPAHNPIIVHVAGLEMARQCVAEWNSAAEKLAAAFWPGPLTIVLPKSTEIPDVVTAGGKTVGIRWPSHAFIQAVIRACGFPLAAPSANPASAVSPTTADHVWQHLGDRIRLVVDGGPTPIGIESTVVDASVQPARLLRPGMIHVESLRAVLPQLEQSGAGEPAPGELRSPGQLRKHYSPRAKLVLLRWENDAELESELARLGGRLAKTFVLAYRRIPQVAALGAVSVMPHEAAAYARALYAELHRCDAAGAGWIVVEAPPEIPEWQAVSDRLRRAAAD